MVERLPCTQGVAGSIPVDSTIFDTGRFVGLSWLNGLISRAVQTRIPAALFIRAIFAGR